MLDLTDRMGAWVENPDVHTIKDALIELQDSDDIEHGNFWITNEQGTCLDFHRSRVELSDACSIDNPQIEKLAVVLVKPTSILPVIDSIVPLLDQNNKEALIQILNSLPTEPSSVQ